MNGTTSLKQLLSQKQIEIERLEAKINAQLPKGRDPLGVKYLERLEQAISLPGTSNNSKKLHSDWETWRKQVQIPDYNHLPYPITIVSCDKFYWPRIEQNRDQMEGGQIQQSCKKPHLGVAFSGFRDCVFKIQCGRKQLHIFRRFQEEREYIQAQLKASHRNPKIIPPSWGIFPLRSGQLIWRLSKKHKNSLQPWQRHRLYLHCTIDERLLSEEGTVQVCSEKIQVSQKILRQSQKKTSTTQDNNQTNFQKRQQSTLLRLSQGSIQRPHAVPYISNPDLVLGVSLNRQLPLQATVVNLSTHKQVATCTAKQLLQYRKSHKTQSGSLFGQINHNANLIERLQRQRIIWRTVSQKEQSKGKILRSQKIEQLGIYTDRVIARRLVDWAMHLQVSSIVLPHHEGIKDSIEANLQAKARTKYPHYRAIQKRYAQSIRARYPHWSYSRLIQAISDCANRIGIEVKILPTVLADDPAEQAAAMALQNTVESEV